MKSGILNSLLLLSGVALSPMVFADTIASDSDIKQVTVYPGAAKVLRHADVSLPVGKTELELIGLPLSLDINSIRVSGNNDTGGVTLGSVNVKQAVNEDVVLEREKELKDQLKALRIDLKEINDSIVRYEKQIAYVDSMVAGTSGDVANGYKQLPIEQWQQAWSAFDTAVEQAQANIRQASVSRDAISKSIKKVETQISQVSSNQKSSYTATINVESNKVTEASFRVSYLVSGASWQPVYDADLSLASGDIALTVLGSVSQRTGENWDGVDLVLSTLRPSATNQLPDLSPWVIDFGANNFSPLSSSMKMDRAAGASYEIAEERLMKMAPEVDAVQMAAPAQTQIISEFSAEYAVAEKISLQSGVSQQRYTLDRITLPSSIELATTPRFDPRAMVLARSKNTMGTPLLPGQMSLYRDGDFVGNTYLKQALVGEDIRLSFGEDNKVKVNFTPDPDKKSESGVLFGKNKVTERSYLVTITSQHSKPYPIRINEQIPVAANESIRVKMTGAVPKETKVDDKEGVVAWEYTLQPNQEMKMNYGYTVTHPKDRAIGGL